MQDEQMGGSLTSLRTAGQAVFPTKSERAFCVWTTTDHEPGCGAE